MLCAELTTTYIRFKMESPHYYVCDLVDLQSLRLNRHYSAVIKAKTTEFCQMTVLPTKKYVSAEGNSLDKATATVQRSRTRK